jgi:biotin synthesis protein BioG
MNAKWLFQNSSDTLVLFFAGWGMDRRPFAHLASKHDVLILYDYRNLALPLDMEELLSRYDTCRLIAWSLGTAVANQLCMPCRDKLTSALAVNGTTRPADDECGVPPTLLDRTIANLSSEGLARFQHRMFRDKELLLRYRASAPLRTLADMAEELRQLRHFPLAEACLFTDALVGRDDRIITAENQRNCWDRFNVPHRAMDAPHYPFYRWNSWEEIGTDHER